jgi:hypothetical protein
MYFFFFQPTIQASNLDKLSQKEKHPPSLGERQKQKEMTNVQPRNNTHEHKKKNGGHKEQPKF